MDLQYVCSIVFLAVFVCSVALRAAMLRKKGIKAIVFGATDKSDWLLIPFVLAIIAAATANALGFRALHFLFEPFWASRLPGALGLLLCLAADIGIILSLKSFGDSFRVGIDEESPGGLIDTGMFAISRNPIYLCFDLFFAGMLLVHRNLALSLAMLFIALIVHRQILREEKFLLGHYGADYERYCKRVRRYL